LEEAPNDIGFPRSFSKSPDNTKRGSYPLFSFDFHLDP